MVNPPITILIELLQEIIKSSIGVFEIIYIKLTELFISLSIISGINPLGFVIALVFGSLVLFFIIKFVFGSSKTLLVIFLFYLILLIMVAISLLTVGQSASPA